MLRATQSGINRVRCFRAAKARRRGPPVKPRVVIAGVEYKPLNPAMASFSADGAPAHNTGQSGALKRATERGDFALDSLQFFAASLCEGAGEFLWPRCAVAMFPDECGRGVGRRQDRRDWASTSNASRSKSSQTISLVRTHFLDMLIAFPLWQIACHPFRAWRWSSRRLFRGTPNGLERIEQIRTCLA